MYKAHMPNKKRSVSKILVGIVAAIAVIGVLFFYFRSKQAANKPSGLVTAAKHDIVQEVEVTGRTKPIHDVALAFERSGRILSVGTTVGSEVKEGDVLARLDDTELKATLAGQIANIEAQVARLNDLKAGARQEDIDVSRADLAKANQDLANLASGASDILNDAYAKCDDAVRKQVDALFTNDESPTPELTFSIADPGVKTYAETGRLKSGEVLAKWKTDLSTLLAPLSVAQAKSELTRALDAMSFVRSFLLASMDAVSKSLTLSQTTSDTYKASINTARSQVNAAIAAANAQVQSLASQEITVRRLEDALALKIAGATPEAIAAADAAVKQARSAADATRVQIQKTALLSPVSGIVTKQDAKVGEIATANSPLISIIAKGGMEIEANIPEVDIGKISIGNPVTISVDALPRETFSGRVSYIDPAETIIDGVVNFKIKISFDAEDPRIKSGMSTPLVIQTLKKPSVLALPQYTIIETDEGTFVRIPLDNGAAQYVEKKVEIGVRGADSYVEILSGLSEGEKVLPAGIRSGAGQ